MTVEFETYIQNAIDWAKQQLGSTAYGLRCLAFVEDAYEHSNRVEIFGGSSAQESADEYGAAQNTGTPTIGSFVFYGCNGVVNGESKDWGYVGLCLGDGQGSFTPGTKCVSMVISTCKTSNPRRRGPHRATSAGHRSNVSLSDTARGPNRSISPPIG
ncbi:MAG TPA: hypothetical protein VFF59_01325 [Anaerolineae bacterium]|nr:hypothetical protein [Anaerolineae bacterium]